MDTICRQLADSGIKAEIFPCSTFDEMAAEAARLATLQDGTVITAAGGDGTINAVFNGLAGWKATCAIIPMGTANVMAIELGIISSEDSIARIIAGDIRPLTAGLIRNSGRSSRFFLMAGVGLDGQIVRGVTLKTKKILGKGAYGLSALQSLAAWDSREIQITTEHEEFSCNSLIVTNAARYGGSFLLSGEASLFSPDFELVAIKGYSRRSAVHAITGILSAQSRSEALYRTKAARITINTKKPVQADGDDWGDSPLEIIAEPDYAEIII